MLFSTLDLVAGMVGEQLGACAGFSLFHASVKKQQTDQLIHG